MVRQYAQPQATSFLLQVREVAFGYDRLLFSGVNLEIHAGEFWVFLGPNGSGKTSLLKIMMKLLEPWEGIVEIAPGFSLSTRSGFVPQKLPSLTVKTTVEEFVELGLVGLRRSRYEMKEQLNEVLEELDLQALRRSEVSSLSGGEERRLLLARALIRHPDLLFLDEPTAGLDPKSEEDFLQRIQDLNHHKGITIILITQELEHRRLATHIALFAQGRVFSGTRKLWNLDEERWKEFYYRKGTFPSPPDLGWRKGR